MFIAYINLISISISKLTIDKLFTHSAPARKKWKLLDKTTEPTYRSKSRFDTIIGNITNPHP